MKVLKNKQIIEIEWKVSDQPDAEGRIIFPYKTFLANQKTLLARTDPTGVILDGGASLDDIANALDNLELIALEFHKFTDGRCFTLARLLREAYGFQGDILATGDILTDQIAHMQRCGINLLRLRNEHEINMALGALTSQTVFYQPAADDQQTIRQLRYDLDTR